MKKLKELINKESKLTSGFLSTFLTIFIFGKLLIITTNEYISMKNLSVL